MTIKLQGSIAKVKQFLSWHSASTTIGVVLSTIFIIYGFQKGIFSSTETFAAYIGHLGLAGCIVFILVQAIQVVVPILPGAIGCLAGVVAFGPVYGLLYNYLGICIGSIIAFAIAKKSGHVLVKKLVGSKGYHKYINWLDRGQRFEALFAAAIFSPVAPDDLLCYLAGLTKMTYSKFITIIILCKPFSIAIYSFGLTGVLNLMIR